MLLFVIALSITAVHANILHSLTPKDNNYKEFLDIYPSMSDATWKKYCYIDAKHEEFYCGSLGQWGVKMMGMGFFWPLVLGCAIAIGLIIGLICFCCPCCACCLCCPCPCPCRKKS